MKYRVIVTDNAKANLRSYYAHAAKHAPLTAERWLNRFEQALATLATNPERCTLAPENDVVVPELRQLFFGKPPFVGKPPLQRARRSSGIRLQKRFELVCHALSLSARLVRWKAILSHTFLPHNSSARNFNRHRPALPMGR